MEYSEVYRALKYPSISNESFVETLQKVIDALIARIKRWLEATGDYIENGMRLDIALNSVKRLRESTFQTGLKTTQSNITVTSRIRHLTVNYNPVKTHKALMLALDNLTQNLTTVYNYKSKLLNDPKLTPEVGIGFHKYSNTNGILRSSQLLGSKQIELVKDYAPRLIEANGEVSEIPTEFEFARMTAGHSRDVLDTLTIMLTKAKEHYAGPNARKRRKVLSDAVKELERLKVDAASGDRVMHLSLFTSNLNALEVDLYELNIKVADAVVKLVRENLTAE